MISVIIPTFNRASTISKSINSVINQTYQDIEVIIVDDGSTDNTKEVVESFSDARIKYVYQENKGACAARNAGIKKATGDYIAFQDSDDIWHADKLEKQFRILNETNAGIVFCKLNHISNGSVVTVEPSYFTQGIAEPVRNIFSIGTQTLLVKKEVFKETLFDEQLPRLQDLEWLYRATKKSTICCLDEGLVDYYVGNDSISMNNSKLSTTCTMILQKHPDLAECMPDLAKSISWDLYKAAVNEKRSNGSLYSDLLCLSKKYNASIKYSLIRFLSRFGYYWGV